MIGNGQRGQIGCYCVPVVFYNNSTINKCIKKILKERISYAYAHNGVFHFYTDVSLHALGIGERINSIQHELAVVLGCGIDTDHKGDWACIVCAWPHGVRL